MVDGLDADDLGNESVIVAVNVFDELELRGGRTDNKNLGRCSQSLRDVVIIVFRVRGMLVFCRRMRVPADVVMRSVDDLEFERLFFYVKNLCFFVVNPDSNMMMGHETILCEDRAGQQLENAAARSAERGQARRTVCTPGASFDANGPGAAISVEVRPDSGPMTLAYSLRCAES